MAEQYFPRLEQPNGIMLTAVDTKGREYTFKYRFWINNQTVRVPPHPQPLASPPLANPLSMTFLLCRELCKQVKGQRV